MRAGPGFSSGLEEVPLAAGGRKTALAWSLPPGVDGITGRQCGGVQRKRNWLGCVWSGQVCSASFPLEEQEGHPHSRSTSFSAGSGHHSAGRACA